MLTIPVKQRKIFGTNKGDMWIFYSVIIWLVVTLTLLFVYFGTDNPVFLIVFFISFLCIIPIFIICYRKSNKYRGDNAVFVGDVTFRAENGELFAGEIKVSNIRYSFKEKCIYVNDTENVKSEVKGISISVPKSSFIGVIEEPFVTEFSNFMETNGIKVKK